MSTMSGRTGPRRVGLPRPKSTSNMVDSGFSREAFRDLARDAVVERDNLRALTDFFRTTMPPSETRNSLSADEECTVFCGADGRKLLWSGQSLRGRSKRSRSQQFQPASTHLPSGVTLETTADGNPYALISLPISIEGSGPWFQAPETIFRAPTQIITRNSTPPAAGLDGNGGWPERTSSRGTLSPTTPLPAIPSRRSSVGVAAGRKTPRNGLKPERSLQQHQRIHEACALESITSVIKRYGSEPASLRSTPALEPSEQTTRAAKVLESSAAAQAGQALSPGSELSGAEPTSPSSGRPTTPHSNGTKECDSTDGGGSCCPTRQWPMPSPTSPLPPTPSLHHRRQMSKGFSLGGAGSPTSTTNSPCKSPRALASLAVQSGLQVPQTKTLPDSPGFAKMLALTTFPSPPCSSRPSTARSNSTGTITSSPSPPGSPPTIRPRTSSKSSAASTNGRHVTSNKQVASSSAPSSAVLLPTASLNEIVMRPDCHDGLQHAPASDYSTRPDQHNAVIAEQGQPQMPPTTNQTSSLLSSAAAQLARRESMDSTSVLVDAFGRPESAASFATARERPDSVYSVYDVAAATAGDSQRVSKASDLTITTDSYQQSLATSRASQQSARSDTTTTTIDSTNANDDCGRHIASSRTSLDIDDLSDETRLSPSKVFPQIQQVNSAQGAAAPEGSAPVRQTAADVPRPDSRNAVEESNVQQSLLERRMARRTARKVWALDTNHGEDKGRLAQAPSGEQAFRRRISQSVDSPVLGWFPGGNGSGGGGALRSHLRSSVSGPSPLANETLTSLPSPPTESDEKRCSTYSTSSAPFMQGGSSPAFPAPANPSRPLRHQLSISYTMVMETIPDEIPESPASTVLSEHLTISPIFIVANLEPGIGATTPSRPRPLSHMFLGQANFDMNHRSPLAKVKAKPRQRPLSVRIARNSLTGLLERTESPAVPVDHTMSRMTTPPETPEPFLNRRLSAMRPLPVRLPTPEPTPLSKHSDVDDMSSSSEEEEERPNPTQRLANIKERLRKEKQQKEEEITSMIARTVITAPRTQEDHGTSYDDEPSHNASYEDEATISPGQEDPTSASREDETVGESRDIVTPTTPELEQRIETLSRKGDAWTGVMGPLMKNMSRMLLEMQGDGMCIGLSMREFSVDKEAEAKRISIYGQAAPSTRVGATPDAHTKIENTSSINIDSTFDGFDGIQPAAEKMVSTPATNDKQPRKGRSASNLARLRLDLDGSVKTPLESQVTEDAEKDAKSEMDKPSGSDVSVPSTPRSPTTNLGEDALMSISRRMQAQEALMDKLMNRWGTPNSRYKSRNESSLSDYDSSRPSMTSGRKSSGDSSESGLGESLERAFPRASTTDLTTAKTTTTTQDESSGPRAKHHMRNNQSGMDLVDSLMGELRSPEGPPL